MDNGSFDPFATDDDEYDRLALARHVQERIDEQRRIFNQFIQEELENELTGSSSEE